MLNRTDEDAQLAVDVFFTDRPPVTVEGLVCGAGRVRHFRLDDPLDMEGFEIPVGTDYGIVVRASAAVSLQYTRVDTRSTALTLMTTAGQPVAALDACAVPKFAHRLQPGASQDP
ncbi:sensory rhodopsin transducer [Streptosporangium sp. NPDC006013]|uniref:sensory rhodopsin transducer n=1 Tax=Streptosporangium sp. NPDC006013 TaxID=3155596 RepID=UPI0033AF5E61